MILIIISNLSMNLFFGGLSQSDLDKVPQLFTLDSSTYSSHSPISIDGNADFLTQASSNNWVGNGSVDNPIIIENYNITSSATEHMIMILNTDLHFIIRNNLLNGVNGLDKVFGDGIWLNNVRNGQIINNTICSNKMGISLEPNNKHNLITGNMLYNNSASAIHLYQSDFNVITKNIIFKNLIGGSDLTMQGDGIELGASKNNSIQSNIIYENPGTGIIVRDGNYNNLSSNMIYLNQDGITLEDDSKSNNIINNTIFNQTIVGIHLKRSVHNIILTNTITNSSSHGIAIFIFNNLGGTSQAKDDGTSNTVIYNYWYDWNIPDSDLDQFMDEGYPLDGSANNHDPFPLTLSFKNYPHPTITKPSPPQTLTAIPGDNRVSLSWETPNDDGGLVILKYIIYRALPEGAFLYLDEIMTTNFTDSTVAGGINYKYAVTAINSVGESSFSNEVNVTPTGSNPSSTTTTTTTTTTQAGSFSNLLIISVFIGFLALILQKRIRNQ
jgi:parallel beta-helix repeat protein